MKILLANIGTSDLAVEIDGYWFPVGFDRSEPGIDDNGLTDEQKKVWEKREEIIIENLCSKLEVDVVVDSKTEKKFFSFRELTQKLLENYNDWHQRIIPGRIYGVIQKSYDLGIKKAYVFVTDQEPKHHQDTFYLFNILQFWLKEKLPGFELINQTIPAEIKKLNEFDPVLHYYQIFFNKLTQNNEHNKEIFVSTKGGTPAMQNALKLQSISFGLKKLIFIDPSLTIQKVLTGQPSECKLTSYWQYSRQQKYQVVKQLLNRWDFDGSLGVLSDFKESLVFLRENKAIELKEIMQTENNIERITKVLDCTRSLFDLDIETARKIIEDNQFLSDIKFNNALQLKSLIDNYDSVVNLYTQFFIYQELQQIGSCLTILSSFYEAVLDRIIEKCGGYQYLNNNDRLNLTKLKNHLGEQLYSTFQSDIQKLQNERINTRPLMRSLIGILLKYRKASKDIDEIDDWQNHKWLANNLTIKGVNELLKEMDFWIFLRNQLIHSANGISINRIHIAYQERYHLFQSKIQKQVLDEACTYEQIPEIITQILNNRLLKLRRDDKINFVGTNKFYIYSLVKDWVIEALMSDLTLL